MLVRAQLILGALVMLVGLVLGVLGPVIGPHLGYWGWHDGMQTHGFITNMPGHHG